MHVFTIANTKGGEGKTTTAIFLARFLQALKHRVLFIDLDGYCNATKRYNVETNNSTTIYDVLMDKEVPIENAIQHGKYGDIIAGDRRLQDYALSINHLMYRHVNCLKHALKTINNKYDYVVIDTSPINTYSIYAGLAAANSVIIPASFGVHWAHFLKDINNIILDIKEVFNPQLEVDGILITRYLEAGGDSYEMREKRCLDMAGQYNIDIFETRIHHFGHYQDFKRDFRNEYIHFCIELLVKHNLL